ncbi:hypothetical protein ACX9I7_00725 [Streptomyces sp. L500]
MNNDTSTVTTGPMPSKRCPELGLLMAEAADSLHRGASLFDTLLELAESAWAAGHIQGEDHCTGCTERGAGGHNWPARQDAVLGLFPNARAFTYRSIWGRAKHDGALLPHCGKPDCPGSALSNRRDRPSQTARRTSRTHD